ncbi:MAG: Gfo/Idh/MocA family oxidoreductase [Tepidisphaeraceae bacterium]
MALPPAQFGPRIPVGVIGCGRMGRLHARVYSQMPNVQLVGVFDEVPESARTCATDYQCEAFDSLDQLIGKVQAVTVAVPTIHHVRVAEKLLPHRIACLIEKPLAESSTQAKRIVDLAREHKTPVMVGHIERFNPAVRALREMNITPQFIEVTRISPLTFRSIDVGVVLDMMIHDIDIILRLANSKVQSIDSVGVSVLDTAEDICNARVRFENGCVANFTASRLAMKTERKLRVFSAEAYVSLDYQKKYGIFVKRGQNLEAIRDVVRGIRSGEIEDLSEVNYAELADVQELVVDDTEPLRAELDSFIGSIASGTPLEVPAEDGLAAVELAERIVASIPKRVL